MAVPRDQFSAPMCLSSRVESSSKVYVLGLGGGSEVLTGRVEVGVRGCSAASLPGLCPTPPVNLDPERSQLCNWRAWSGCSCLGLGGGGAGELLLAAESALLPLLVLGLDAEALLLAGLVILVRVRFSLVVMLSLGLVGFVVSPRVPVVSLVCFRRFVNFKFVWHLLSSF